MARSPFSWSPLRARAARLTEHRHIRDQLMSVAGLVGRPARLADGRDVGPVVDIVARWTGEPYPAIAGLVLRVGRRRAFVPIVDIAELTGATVTLASGRLDVRDFERRTGEVMLMRDVVDHQLVDVDGVQVVRAADLYLSDVDGVPRLVGVEVGLVSLLRRMGPARWRTRATPERVIDWAAIQPVGPAGTLRADRTNVELRRLRPGDLADLLEKLGHPQRQVLVGALDSDTAADALEEMDEAGRDHLLRHLAPDRLVEIVAAMEPDEAAEALRPLDAATRAAIITALPDDLGAALSTVLAHPADRAGGIMTTALVVAHVDDTVATVVARLSSVGEHRADIDGVLVVDADGRLLDDISLYELIVAPVTETMGALVGEPWPIVLDPAAALHDVVDAVLSNRRSSVVVVDGEGRPIGRILADDVVDALVPARGRRHADVGGEP
jgi:CBS domain-containing protein